MSRRAPRKSSAQPPIHGPAAPVLEALFAKKGIPTGEWWPFFVQGEGKDLPGGLESLSGFLLTRDGRVFGWWLDAGPDGAPALDRWWPVEDPQQEFAHDPEYRAAKRHLRPRT